MTIESEITENEFLNKLKKNRIKTNIYLLNGIRLKGYIINFNENTIFLENEESYQKGCQMIFKNSISTISIE